MITDHPQFVPDHPQFVPDHPQFVPNAFRSAHAYCEVMNSLFERAGLEIINIPK